MAGWTSEHLAAFYGNRASAKAPERNAYSVTFTPKVNAKGRIPKPRGQNKTEARYAQYLELQKRAGAVAWFRFEGITLKLAHDTRLTLDFAVMLPDGTLELHDCKVVRKGGTKAHVEDDAVAKMQVAAAMFPFVIRTVWPLPSGAWGSKMYGE